MMSEVSTEDLLQRVQIIQGLLCQNDPPEAVFACKQLELLLESKSKHSIIDYKSTDTKLIKEKPKLDRDIQNSSKSVTSIISDGLNTTLDSETRKHFLRSKNCPSKNISVERVKRNRKILKSPAVNTDRDNSPSVNITKISEKNNISSDKSKNNSSKENTILKKNTHVDSKNTEKIEFTANTILSNIYININKKSDVDKKNKKGETLFHVACIRLNQDKAKNLLMFGANVNTKDYAGWTPLHEVTHKKSVSMVKFLLENGAFTDIPGPSNDTPLHDAVSFESMEIAKLLIKYGANIYAKNSKGITPIDIVNEKFKSILITEMNSSKIVKTDFCQFSIFNKGLNIDLKIYPSNLNKTSLAKLNSIVKCHNNVTVVDKLSDDVSFVLKDCIEEGYCLIDIDSLTASVLGVPIVNSDWLVQCNSSNLDNLLNFEIVSIGGTAKGVQLSYHNRLKYFPKLFNNCHFFFYGINIPYEINPYLKVSKEMLTRLITLGGGIVLKREPNPESIPIDEQIIPFHVSPEGALSQCSHFIIYVNCPQLVYNMKHLKTLSVAWLIESIRNFKLVDPQRIH